MDKWNREVYETLPADQREALLRELAQTRNGLKFVKTASFQAFGQTTCTAIYRSADGAEFVFVPGGEVTLGWQDFSQGMDDATREDMTESLEEYGVTDLLEFLRQSCTPVRQAVVPAMLVERRVREIGWYNVPLDHPDIQGDDELKDYLDRFQRNANAGMWELDETLKLQRKADNTITAQLYQPCGWQELLDRTAESGFSIATEDEWEYLCGGGSRTLWRWGDSFDYTMKIPHFKVEGEADSWNIRWPNQFGLEIAFDPYIQEVVSGPETILKAGDGGCNICGGLGIAMGFLPVATYYKGTAKADDELGYLEDIGGDYTCYRRIIRL